MNAENLLRVADAIEKHEIAWLGFNMETFISDYSDDKSGHRCGTTGCIAGWAFAIERSAKSGKDLLKKFQSCGSIRSSARKFFGLDWAESEELFEGAPAMVAGPAEAVRTLRYAAKHGVIDWDAAQAEAA